MKCSEIKKYFSEYVDGRLKEQEKTEVEEHLSTCKACRKELASVKALIRELGALYSVKAPTDYLENVHKRMASEPIADSFAGSNREKVIRKIFFPWRIKIPLKLAVAAALAVLALAVYNIQPPQKPKETFLKATAQTLKEGHLPATTSDGTPAVPEPSDVS